MSIVQEAPQPVKRRVMHPATPVGTTVHVCLTDKRGTIEGCQAAIVIYTRARHERDVLVFSPYPDDHGPVINQFTGLPHAVDPECASARLTWHAIAQCPLRGEE